MLQKVKPYAAMILLQLSYAVMYVVLLATLKNGMKQPVLLVYRNSVAALFMIPFALWFERVLDQNFYFMGAKQTSAGFASALENINPSIAFVMALLIRVEKMDIRQRHGQAKIIGAGVTIAGTIIMILYKGPTVEFFWTNGRQGVVCSGLSYFILGMVMVQKGPVFASAFNPLTMILTTILSSIFLAEKTTLGTIIGATIIVIGLYSLLWGKSIGDPTPSKNGGKVEDPGLPVTTPIEQRPVEMITDTIAEQRH
ncbi:WAT1-related protein [Platanthera guangdongensis]|uniref:WAT1-related protein n=1 Tax=Platanthera guangdongensis TaxID=2320717 RepID=A0ABR2LIW1_9ASPA